MKKKRALITGIAGQDGSYLAELLLEKGYEVYGLEKTVLQNEKDRVWNRISHLKDRIEIHEISIEDLSGVSGLIRKIRPDECYHLAAQSFVSYDAALEIQTNRSNIDGTHHLLISLRAEAPESRFFFAASSEVFGNTAESPQTEATAFHPRSVYGISKAAGFDLTRFYREKYSMHASSGILYNHESPRRGDQFVTRKITRSVAAIKLGHTTGIKLGNLDSRRDWGHARDYVRAMWLMLQQEAPDDYVIATGVTHTVREFAERAFRHVGLDFNEHVIIDKDLVRSSETNLLVGNASKANRSLGWKTEISFENMIIEMVDHDMKDVSHKGSPDRR